MSQGFPIMWPSDLVFDPTWPNFELDLDIIKLNILTKFHEVPLKDMASRDKVFLLSDLVFDPKWPNFKLDRDFIKVNILTNFHQDPVEIVACRDVTSKSLRTH